MDLRRVPAAGLDVASDPVLLAGIRAEIAARGPISFARFMEIALYDPKRGYYRGAATRPGRDGDFLTAPEAHPIFGRAIARYVDDVWRALDRPARFTIREHGAGGGALAEALIGGLDADGSAALGALRYRVVEVEPARVTAVRARLEMAGRSGRLETDDGHPIDGLVLANEVLDALPTHRLVVRGGELREILVGLDPDGGLIDVEAAPTTPLLARRLADEAIDLAEGQHAEVCLAIDAWVAAAAAGLARGVLLLIDYGHPAAELYDPARRAAGTLAAYLRHQVHDDPYRAIGRQDLTAHVDVTAVERAAVAAGLVHLGTTTQAAFLDRLGAGEILVDYQQGPAATLQEYLTARAALVRMIDPAAMGRFRVMAFGRGLSGDGPRRGL
ncbi:MAG TPA: SAM-dependent methyltransferase [Candidatus Limnocylindrales bacterium]|nr:SAM-dependent methyltransferase [Candidatus Limnocylindrales bacterium]